MNVKDKYLIAKVLTYVFCMDKKFGRRAQFVPFRHNNNTYYNLLGSSERREVFHALKDLPEFDQYLEKFAESRAFVVCDDPHTVDAHYSGEFLDGLEYIRMGTLIERLRAGEAAHVYVTTCRDPRCLLAANEDFYLATVVNQFYSNYVREIEEQPCYHYERHLMKHLRDLGATNMDWTPYLETVEDTEPAGRQLKFEFEGFRFVQFDYS